MIRTFIAIKFPLSRQTAELVGDIKLRLKDERIKWVDLWNMHLTLFFLGDTEENLIPEIAKDLSENLKGFKSFNLVSKGFGVFRNIKDPRAIWFGLEENHKLIELKQKVNASLNNFGFETEHKKFKPHLTLGRVKYLKQSNTLKDLIEELKDNIIQENTIDEVILFKSELTPKGPVYSILKKFELN